jgi:plastocyanin
MRRSVAALALAVVSCAFLLVAPGTAGAGGFCSDGNFTDARGTTVELSKFCMTPTILRVDKGAEVTFQNNDPELHMLGGVNNAFGNLHTELRPKESISYTFNDDGVFPYLCILHPGMAGAIVVGDGAGKISNASVTGGAVLPPADSSEPEEQAAPAGDAEQPANEPTSSTVPGNLWLLAGIVAAMSAGFWWLRRKAQPQS